jgi:glucose/arabinose dehydrogenase
MPKLCSFAHEWPNGPQTGELWCSVNERDGLGDNLLPEYITIWLSG